MYQELSLTKVPALFTKAAAPTTTSRYQFVDTQRMLQVLGDAGFHPIRAFQQRTRTEDGKAYAKHQVVLRSGSLQRLEVGDVVPEIHLVNSHGGQSAVEFSAGLYRCICSNQMCVGDTDFGSFKLRHTHTEDDIIEGIFHVVEDLPGILDQAQSLREIQVSRDAQVAYAEGAALIRWDEAPLEPASLLIPRRSEDKSSDLWTVYNRVQEALIKGGNSAKTKTGKRTSTRGISGLDENNRINKALWAYTQAIAKTLQ